MILVTGTVAVADGRMDEMLAAVRAMVSATLEEEGCHECRYAVSLDDPQTITFHEAWASPEATQAHGATPHMATFGQTMMPLLAGPPQATMWDAEQREMG